MDCLLNFTLIIRIMDSIVKLFEIANRHRERKLDRNQIRIIPRTRFDLKWKKNIIKEVGLFCTLDNDTF